MRGAKLDRMLLVRIVFAAFVLFAPAIALAQPVSSPKLTELLTEQELLLAEMEEIGGSRLSTEAIANTQGEIYELRQIAETYGRLAEDLEITQAELQRMQREAEQMKTEPGGSATDKAKRKIAEEAAKRLLEQAAKRVLKIVGIVVDAVETAYLHQIKTQTVETLRSYVRSGQLKQREVQQLLTAVYHGMAAEENNRRRLVAIQERTRTLAGDIAVERKRLEDLAQPATKDAFLIPDHDPAGDAEEREKHNKEGIVPAGRSIEIDWRRDDFGLNSIDTYVCPPNPDRQFSNASLVGTDRYLTKSPVCLAAAHAGVITVELGGRLRLIFFAGQDTDTYQGSERNGIRSGSWNRNWGGFSVAIPR